MAPSNEQQIAPRVDEPAFSPEKRLPAPKQNTERRRNVTVACSSCRLQRIKCDGQQPCRKCATLGAECTYSSDLDGRSVAAIKRKYSVYERDQRILNDLLSTFKDSTTLEISQIVSIMRSDAPLEEVKSCVELQLQGLHRRGERPSPELEELQDLLGRDPVASSNRTASAGPPLTIDRLIHKPLYQLSATPWTAVTSDDELVSSLISTWLTWDHIWYDWMDCELFLRDMKRGEIQSRYCSPFLVSALLAWASWYSDAKDVRSQNGKSSLTTLAFIEEAKQRLDDELVRDGPNITGVQGTMFLFLAISLSGQDRLGYRYMIQAIDLAQELSRSYRSLDASITDVEARDLADAICHTCWGTYNIITASYLSFMRCQTWKKPQIPKPGIKRQNDRAGVMWQPYPNDAEPTPSHIGELFDVLCDVSVIGSDLSRLVFPEDETTRLARPEEVAAVLKLYGNLKHILEMLPPYLQISPNAPVAVLVHQMWFRVIQLRMFLCLRKETPGTSPGSESDYQEKCIQLALEIAQACKFYIDAYGASYLLSMFTQATSMAVYVLLETPDMNKYSAEVTDLCVCLRAVGRRWPMSLAILRMVQLTAQQLGKDLPPATDILFQSTTYNELKTIYPDPASTTSKRDDVVDMAKFLKQMEHLNFQSTSGAKDDSGHSS